MVMYKIPVKDNVRKSLNKVNHAQIFYYKIYIKQNFRLYNIIQYILNTIFSSMAIVCSIFTFTFTNAQNIYKVKFHSKSFNLHSLQIQRCTTSVFVK